MRKFNISKPRKYIKDGVEKTYWDKVGEMVEFEKDGRVSRIIKIPAIGLEANVFEEEARSGETPRRPLAPAARETTPAPVEYPDVEINPEDIPF